MKPIVLRSNITDHCVQKGKYILFLMTSKVLDQRDEKELMKYFKDLGQIKTATVTELLNVPGMNQSTAESIYGFFTIPSSKEIC